MRLLVWSVLILNALCTLSCFHTLATESYPRKLSPRPIWFDALQMLISAAMAAWSWSVLAAD